MSDNEKKLRSDALLARSSSKMYVPLFSLIWTTGDTIFKLIVIFMEERKRKKSAEILRAIQKLIKSASSISRIKRKG